MACTDCPPFTGCTDCGYTDDFSRTVAEVVHNANAGTTNADMGTSDAGILYGNLTNTASTWLLSNGGVGLSVDGQNLVVRLFCNSGSGVHLGQASALYRRIALTDHSAVKRMTFVLSVLPSHTGNTSALTIGFGVGGPSGTKAARVFINDSGSGAFASSYVGFTATTSDGTVIPDSWWQTGVTYTITLRDDGTDTILSVSNGTATYTRTSAGYSGDIIDEPVISVYAVTSGGIGVTGEMTVTIAYVDIPEINRCTVYDFDVFQRTNASAWGGVWTLTTHSNDAESVFPGRGSIELLSSGGTGQAVLESTVTTGQWWMNDTYDMVVPFRSDDLANTGLLRLLFFEPTFATYRLVDLRMATNLVELGGSGGSASAAYSAWANQDIMFVRFQQRGGIGFRARVWRYDEPEPVTWLVEVLDADATVVPTLRVEADDGGGVTDVEVRVYWLAFTFTGKACYDGGPVAQPLLSQAVVNELVGYGDGSSTAFFVNYAYNPVSLQVEVNGFLSDVDATDPSSGAFTLTLAPSSGAEIRATYRAASF